MGVFDTLLFKFDDSNPPRHNVSLYYVESKERLLAQSKIGETSFRGVFSTDMCRRGKGGTKEGGLG